MIQAFQKTFQFIMSAFGTHSGVILDESDLDIPIRFQDVFSNQNPTIVEFGVGKGRFIRDYAMVSPNKNFFGVEKVNKWVNHAAERIEKANLSNVRLIKSSAEYILSNIPASSVCEFYILFPDPWPKRRHNERRVIQKKVLHEIHNALVTDGKLYIATDHAQYYDWIRNLVNPMIGHQFDEIYNARPTVISNYQVKYEKEGRPIYSTMLQKI